MSTLNPLFSKPIISYSKTCFFFDKFLNKCAIIADNANNKTTNHTNNSETINKKKKKSKK